MDRKVIDDKVRRMKADIIEMLSDKELEPFIKCNLESIDAHVTILYNELGLDVE